MSSDTDSTVHCDKCGAEQFVNFSICLRAGWPKCHGYTMRLVTTDADITESVGGVFAPIREDWVRVAIAAQRRREP